jgi:hypothetical protein
MDARDTSESGFILIDQLDDVCTALGLALNPFQQRQLRKYFESSKSDIIMLSDLQSVLVPILADMRGLNIHGIVGEVDVLIGEATKWECIACTYVNDIESKSCCICLSPQPEEVSRRDKATQLIPWTCDKCTFYNSTGGKLCEVCESTQPDCSIKPAFKLYFPPPTSVKTFPLFYYNGNQIEHMSHLFIS